MQAAASDEVLVRREGRTMDGKSIMGVLLLAAVIGGVFLAKRDEPRDEPHGERPE